MLKQSGPKHHNLPIKNSITKQCLRCASRPLGHLICAAESMKQFTKGNIDRAQRIDNENTHY